jgi:hypothetical protein
VSDHDGHTIDAGPVTAGTCGCSNNFGHTCEEVARLRAENTALAAALEDIAGITYSPAHEVYVNGECHRFQDPPCHEAEPTDPEDWCVTCVAEVAWSAWKMGVLG